MEKRLEFFMTSGIAADMDRDISFASEIADLINRYINGDWGELCEEDKELNRIAIKEGGRVLAAYQTSGGKVYIITDDAKAESLVTTVLYASEY